MTTTATRERPILFSGEMVRAILDGRKTMTRRLIKEVPTHLHLDRPIMNWPLSGLYEDAEGRFWLDVQTAVDDCSHTELLCPYGKPGDRLWVRETWAPSVKAGNRQIAYAADGRWGSPSASGQIHFHGWTVGVTDKTRSDWQELNGNWVGRGYFDKWKPSIHMPRWASRLALEITGVRVERLQEISEEDAKAEGVDAMRDMRFAVALGNLHATAFRLNFMDLWQSINGPDSWKANPWVWAITFKPLTPEPTP